MNEQAVENCQGQLRILPRGEDELVQRAFRKYFGRYGKNAMQPSNTSGIVNHAGQDYVGLEDVNGVLAVYGITPNETLWELATEKLPKGLRQKLFFAGVAKP